MKDTLILAFSLALGAGLHGCGSTETNRSTTELADLSPIVENLTCAKAKPLNPDSAPSLFFLEDDLIASVTLTTSCVEGALDRMQVDILDAKGRLLSRKGEYTVNPGSRVEWMSATSLVLTDGLEAWPIDASGLL